jgi:hypothetical protein
LETTENTPQSPPAAEAEPGRSPRSPFALLKRQEANFRTMSTNYLGPLENIKRSNSTIIGKYRTLITELLQLKNLIIKKYNKGTIVQKKTKYKSSSTYFSKDSLK